VFSLAVGILVVAGLSGFVATASAASTVSIAAAADSYVDSGAASANFGSSPQLRVDGSPVIQAYVRFDLRSLSGSVTNARLELYANSASSVGYDVAGTDGTAWTEAAITSANVPGITAPVGSAGPFAAATTTSVDVTSAVQAGSIVDLAIVARSATAISFGSRESVNPPRLVVTVGSVTIGAAADSYVDATVPTANFGTATQLRVDGAPVVTSYLRFDLSSMVGSVADAKLQIYANSASNAGYSVARTTGAGWTEIGLTSANAPGIGAVVGISGPLAAGTTATIDVTSAVQTGTLVDFAIVARDGTAISLASRESAHPPTLLLTLTGGPTPPPATAIPSQTATPAPTAPPTVNPTPTAAPTATPVSTPAPTAVPTATTTQPPTGSDPVLIGAGDICITSSIANAQATASILGANPNAVIFTAGDNSNETGTSANYSGCVAKTWGVYKSRIHPVPGNHDYMTAGAAPYYAFYGASAGTPGKGWYSYNLANNWHVISLNALCSEVGGCGVGSPQEVFLKADLAANSGKHIIAIWHIPSFSSGGAHGNNTAYRAWWDDLYAAHADLVLDGHDHNYERFALQSPSAVADPNGIREFVVGTGGAGQRAMGTIRANSQVRSSGTFGVLKLTLHAHSYDWQFIPVAGKTFTDSGTQATHS
jgi:hypothetical protein